MRFQRKYVMVHEEEVVAHLDNPKLDGDPLSSVLVDLWKCVCACSRSALRENCRRLRLLDRARLCCRRSRRFCCGPERKSSAWTVLDGIGRGRLVWSDLHMRDMAMVSMRQVLPVVRTASAVPWR